MKIRFSKSAAGTLIFLFLMAAVFAFLQPLYKAMNKVLKEFEEKYTVLLADKTGLALSYESLSPSILTGISFKGITVSDALTGEKIFTAEKAVAGYSIKKLFDRDFKNVFTDVKIYNVDFYYDSSKLVNVRKKFSELFPSRPRTEGEHFLRDEHRELIKKIVFSLPFDISLRNISFHFNSGKVNLGVTVFEADVKKNRRTLALGGTLDGVFTIDIPLKKVRPAGFRFSAKGNMLPVVDGSMFSVNITPYENAWYSLSPLTCLAYFEGSSFMVRTTEHVRPFGIIGGFNADNGRMNINLSCKSLNPFSVVRFPPSELLFREFGTSKLTSESSLIIDFPTMHYEWKSLSDVKLNQRFFAGGETVRFDADGDNDGIRVSSLNARGETLYADFEGALNLKTLLPEGYLHTEYFTLKNGNRLSGDVSVTSKNNSVYVSVPSFNMGERAFSSIEAVIVPRKGAVDFSASLSDFSHDEFDGNSRVSAEGSLALGEKNYLECSVQVANLFLDSAFHAAGYIIDKKEGKGISSLVPSLSPFIMSTEIYFSTDFSDITYNSPYSIFANTQKDREFLLLSFDGNRNSINISQADLIYGKHSLMARASADISPEDRQLIFSTDFTFNSIPYSLSGIYSSGEWLNVTGDYGLTLVANFSYGVSGTFQFSSLPLSMENLLLAFSSEASFSYNSKDDFSVQIHSLEAEEIGNRFILHPKLSLSAELDSKGIVFSTLLYADSFSTLEGNGYTLWNINSGIFDSVNANFELSNPISSEKILFTGNLTNPLGGEISMQTLKSECFFSAEADVVSFPLRRFFSNQPADETMTASLTASGTFENPYINLALQNFSMQVAGTPLFIKGNAAIMEGKLSVPEFSLNWNHMQVSDVIAELDLETFDGTADGKINAAFGERTLYAPVKFTIENLSPEEKGRFIPQNFVVSVDSPEISGSLLMEPFPFNVTLVRSPGRFDIITNEYIGAYGEYLDDGSISLSVQEDKPLHFNMNGTLKGDRMNVAVNSLYADAGLLSYLFNSSMFSLYSGIVTGNLNISGLVTDPDIDGEAFIRGLDFNLPSYIPEHFKTEEVV
ncbi:MAG: hypothetical protein J5780_01170, partial [Treponema sp.]|nr:hypothetical protein [Treponema sp.]